MPAPGSAHWTNRQPFGKRAIPGIFLGWEMDAGCRFRGKYRVAAFCDFDDRPLRESCALKTGRVYSAVTSQITWPADVGPTHTWEFPLLARYLYESEDGLGRISSATGHRNAQRGGQPGSHDGPPPAFGSSSQAPTSPAPFQSTSASSGSGAAPGGASHTSTNAEMQIVPPDCMSRSRQVS